MLLSDILKNNKCNFEGSGTKINGERDLYSLEEVIEFVDELENKAKDRDFWYAQCQEGLKVIEKIKNMNIEILGSLKLGYFQDAFDKSVEIAEILNKEIK